MKRKSSIFLSITPGGESELLARDSRQGISTGKCNRWMTSSKVFHITCIQRRKESTQSIAWINWTSRNKYFTQRTRAHTIMLVPSTNRRPKKKKRDTLLSKKLSRCPTIGKTSMRTSWMRKRELVKLANSTLNTWWEAIWITLGCSWTRKAIKM